VIVNEAPDRILVVEDDNEIREALGLLLEEHGYTVDTARNGAEAVEKVEHDPPSLVISDIMMPDVDGFELVERLRERPAFADIPIILLSALREPDSRIAGLDLGADDYISKPTRPDELLARVRVHLRHAHRQRQLVRRSLVDPLTGALNRRGILSVLRRERERALRTGTPLSVLMLDVDGFKALNDTYGHKAGDIVLRDLARAIVEAVRVVDHVGRLGGDEFVVAVPDGDAAAAAGLASRLSVLELPPLEVRDREPLEVHVSVGVATLTGDETVDELLERADEEMYRHKRSRSTSGGVRPTAH
jgi:two-component system cell cycle response regulator